MLDLRRRPNWCAGVLWNLAQDVGLERGPDSQTLFELLGSGEISDDRTPEQYHEVDVCPREHVRGWWFGAGTGDGDCSPAGQNEGAIGKGQGEKMTAKKKLSSIEKPAAKAAHPTLPEIGMCRWDTLRRFIPLSRESWRKLVIAGKAPQPVKLSARCTMYPNAEVHRWLADPAAYQA